MKSFRLVMLTPERVFYEGEAEVFTMEALDGERQILAGHAPVVIGLAPSMLKIRVGKDEKVLANGEGFVRVERDKVTVLCQTMEWPEEIELNRVNRAIEEHTKKLKDAKSIAEYRLSKMTLARAFARQKVKNSRK